MSTPVSPVSEPLHILLPLRESLSAWWDAIAAGVAAAPDPGLAATNLSRLLDHGTGRGRVLGDARRGVPTCSLCSAQANI